MMYDSPRKTLSQPSLCIDLFDVSRIHQHVGRGYPGSACGLLIGPVADAHTRVRVVKQVVVIPSSGHGAETLIDPKLLLHWERFASRAGQTVLGVFIGQADLPASPVDLDPGGSWPEFVYLLVSVTSGIAAKTAAWVYDIHESQFVEIEMKVTQDDIDYSI